MVSICVPTWTMRIDNYVEAICENVVEWLFMAWDKLHIIKEVHMSGWGNVKFSKHRIAKFIIKVFVR